MDNLGRYQLLEKLGQGGMGIVYRAFDTLLQRVVAVKVISTSTEGNPELRDRFFREARAAGQLAHPNIITIYDLGEYDNQPYLAMEYLEGEDLQQRLLRPDRMSLQHKLQLSIELCAALEFAHKHGVIHRDIKPANVFITDNGTLKILDFGLARLMSSQLTNSNMMMGTLNYMAPEQVRGERADHRSDIFSTGVLMYELLGGRKAFEGDSFASTLYKILQEVPAPLREIDKTIPSELAAMVERAVAKPRDERYQSMSELLRDLTVYRDRLGLYQSPVGIPSALAVQASVERRTPEGAWVGLRATDTVTGVSTPVAPTPPQGLVPVLSPLPQPGLPVPVGSAPGPRRPWVTRMLVPAAGLGLVLAGSVWLLNRPEPGPGVPSAQAQPQPDVEAINSSLGAASRAMQAGDHAAALKAVQAVLERAPGQPEAIRLRDQARLALDAVERAAGDARRLFDAGRFDEAARAAGEVLTLAPAHAEARRIMTEAAARSRGHGADEAHRRMSAAKNAALGAAAPRLAGGSYRAATAAERDAQRLRDEGNLAEATAKYYEASGLFRSAEIAAEAAATERARSAARDVERAGARATTGTEAPRQPDGVPAASPPVVAPPTGAPIGPLGTPAPPPAVPAASRPAPEPAPPAARPPATPPAPSPETEIRDLLARYEAALEARSLNSLRQLWPGLGSAHEDAIRRDFQLASRIEVDIAEPRISVSGASASATFVRTYELLTNDGQPLRSRSRTEMTLRRLGDGWVIQQIRFEPVR
jgi:tetratricopeptide (TPR) repeat protein